MQEMNFCLLSRFNLKWPALQARAGIDSEDAYLAWCESRARIFRELTLRSILAQQRKPDAWFIGFDSEIVPPVARVLEELEPHGFIRPVLAESPVAFMATIRTEIAQLSGGRMIATTRLDSDDALHRNFFAKLRRTTRRITPAALNRQRIAISFPYGVQRVGDRFFAYHQPKNAFLTLVEAAGQSPLTALGFRHREVQRVARPSYVTLTQPLWMQNVHGANASNEARHNLFELGPARDVMHAFGGPAHVPLLKRLARRPHQLLTS